MISEAFLNNCVRTSPVYYQELVQLRPGGLPLLTGSRLQHRGLLDILCFQQHLHNITVSNIHLPTQSNMSEVLVYGSLIDGPHGPPGVPADPRSSAALGSLLQFRIFSSATTCLSIHVISIFAQIHSIVLYSGIIFRSMYIYRNIKDSWRKIFSERVCVTSI